MSELITSAGQVGFDYNRSEGRAYATLDHVVTSLTELQDQYVELKREAEYRGRRRWVLRAVTEGDAASGSSRSIVFHPALKYGKVLEVDIPLSFIDPSSRRHLRILADNIHNSYVPEWSEVWRSWAAPVQREVNPLGYIKSLPGQFKLTNELTQGDVEDLEDIWRPFGWTQSGVAEFIDSYHDAHGLWFSGMRDIESGRLVSACQGEAINFAELFLVEGTEYGTLPGFEGKGLCTAVVTGLHAEILADTLYRDGRMPLIYSELSMTTRSDIVGRKVGMTVPYITERDPMDEETLRWNLGPDHARQVLKYNVAILDGRPQNNVSLEDLGPYRKYFEKSFGENFRYRYWRNFIAAILPREAIDRYYSPEKCQQILEIYNGQ